MRQNKAVSVQALRKQLISGGKRKAGSPSFGSPSKSFPMQGVTRNLLPATDKSFGMGMKKPGLPGRPIQNKRATSKPGGIKLF